MLNFLKSFFKKKTDNNKRIIKIVKDYLGTNEDSKFVKLDTDLLYKENNALYNKAVNLAHNITNSICTIHKLSKKDIIDDYSIIEDVYFTYNKLDSSNITIFTLTINSFTINSKSPILLIAYQSKEITNAPFLIMSVNPLNHHYEIFSFQQCPELDLIQNALKSHADYLASKDLEKRREINKKLTSAPYNIYQK